MRLRAVFGVLGHILRPFSLLLLVPALVDLAYGLPMRALVFALQVTCGDAVRDVGIHSPVGRRVSEAATRSQALLEVLDIGRREVLLLVVEHHTQLCQSLRCPDLEQVVAGLHEDLVSFLLLPLQLLALLLVACVLSLELARGRGKRTVEPVLALGLGHALRDRVVEVIEPLE